MEIEIRKLTPDLAEEYARFHDDTPYRVEGKEDIHCYCVTWRNDETYKGDDHWYPTKEERRERAVRFVKDGKMQGYLAYSGGKIVGWCNTTADCKGGVDFLRSTFPIAEHERLIYKGGQTTNPNILTASGSFATV